MGCRKIQDKEVCNVSNKPLVLCIDDEQNILELLSFNLEASGYDTVTATSGTAGLEQAVSKSPALILLDLMLPDMDGTEVCRQLKAGPTTASIPIIMLTAKDDVSDKVMGLDMGADDYIAKPYKPEELVGTLLFLVDEQASGFVNGVVIPVDGGFSAYSGV